MPVAGVYIELVSIADQDYDAWGQWYDASYRKLRSDVPGVIAVRRCKSVIGSAPAMVVYDLADFTVAYSAPWRDADALARAHDPCPVPASSFDGPQGLVYRQILAFPDASYIPEPTPFLHGAFFEVNGRDHDEFNDWYNTEHIEFIKTVDGYLNCRRFQCLEVPTKFLALYDVVSLADSEAKDVAPQNFTPWATRVRGKLTTYRERRLFRVDGR
ncbi:hypothetical protein [Mycobacterium sp. SMC-4]|uniref:hypothetical protein n=1 Tax=Mycobacterium sp. SMC-4 TaxID=2857059 RepID=UPI003CFE9473